LGFLAHHPPQCFRGSSMHNGYIGPRTYIGQLAVIR
jgi:hypothetical protein